MDEFVIFFNTFIIDGMLQCIVNRMKREREVFDTLFASGYKFSASDCEKLVEEERLVH